MESAPSQKSSKAAAFRARLLSTLILWGVVIGVFLSGNFPLFVVLVALLGVLGSVELFRLTAGIPGKDCRIWALLVSLVYLGGLAWGFASSSGPGFAEGFGLEVGGVILVLLGAFAVRLRHEITGPESVYPVAMAGLAFVYVPVLFSSFTIRVAHLPVEAESVGAGLALVLMVVLATKFTDMGAYLVGSLIGKHKAIPHVSPAKSWEGYIGSMLFTQAGALAVYFIAGDDLSWIGGWGHVVVLSVLINVAASVGDLAESILKRSLKVKDSGQVLPGIGGVLDLLDSLCFTMPLAYFYMIVFVL